MKKMLNARTAAATTSTATTAATAATTTATTATLSSIVECEKNRRCDAGAAPTGQTTKGRLLRHLEKRLQEDRKNFGDVDRIRNSRKSILKILASTKRNFLIREKKKINQGFFEKKESQVGTQPFIVTSRVAGIRS